MTGPAPSRRWPRYAADLPVQITPSRRASKAAVPGRVSAISEGGMALYASIYFEPGDLMEIQFQTPQYLRLIGRVRSRAGYCFGLEFLSGLSAEKTSWVEPWPIELKPAEGEKVQTAEHKAPVLEAVARDKIETVGPLAVPSPNSVFAALHRTDLQIKQVLKEIQALHTVAIMLAEIEAQEQGLHPLSPKYSL
jgi:hypothetical protein